MLATNSALTLGMHRLLLLRVAHDGFNESWPSNFRGRLAWGLTPKG